MWRSKQETTRTPLSMSVALSIVGIGSWTLFDHQKQEQRVFFFIVPAHTATSSVLRRNKAEAKAKDG